MATITWYIEWMKTTSTTATPPECVLTVGWRCVAVEGQYTGTAYGSCSFEEPGDPFTPYAELTQDQVLGWCWSNGVDKTITEEFVQKQIDDQVNPPVIQPPLPWV